MPYFEDNVHGLKKFVDCFKSDFKLRCNAIIVEDGVDSEPALEVDRFFVWRDPEDHHNWVLEYTAYDPGTRDEPPSSDPVELERFAHFQTVARELMQHVVGELADACIENYELDFECGYTLDSQEEVGKES